MIVSAKVIQHERGPALVIDAGDHGVDILISEDDAETMRSVDLAIDVLMGKLAGVSKGTLVVSAVEALAAG